jgi:cell division protein FtsB
MKVEFAMKALMIGLVLVLTILQWRLWAGDGGVGELRQLERQLAEQQAENDSLRLRNQLLESEVLDLKNGLEAVEERARADLGMIRDDETFYMIIE